MLELIKNHRNFLSFAFMVAFFSGFGQTYLISLFNQDIQELLQISKSTLSKVYGLATFSASCMIPLMGRFIDKYTMKHIASLIAFLLGISFFLLAQVTSVIQLFFLFVFIRLLGQSSLPLVGTTQIAKCFGKMRGKVLSMTSMGRPLVESSLPIIIIWCLTHYGFQSAVYVLAALLLLVFIPLTYILLKDFKPTKFYEENSFVKNALSHLSVKEIYSNYRIYLFSFSNITLGFVLTGIFFHNSSLLTFKNWSLAVWGTSFIFMSICSLGFNFLSGYFVDKFGALRVIRFKYIPLIIGLCFLMFGTHYYVSYVFFAFCGMSIGLSANTQAPVLAEIFGSQNLGTIKSVDVMVMVISTSIAPYLFSIILDNYGMDFLFHFLIGFSLFTLLLFNLSLSHLLNLKK